MPPRGDRALRTRRGRRSAGRCSPRVWGRPPFEVRSVRARLLTSRPCSFHRSLRSDKQEPENGSPSRTPAKARKAAAERAAAAAERKRLIANARQDPKAAARVLMPEYGFSQSQWPCLERLWIGESGWNYRAENASSGAYGIPQSLPGSKMATVAGDWRSNPVTQIKWGLDYIKRSYGSPCNALDQWNARSPHWY